MVNIGDTVLVTVRTWIPSLVAGGSITSSSLRSALQSRLQQAGFRVLKIDDNDLSWLSNSYGNMLVSVVPVSSAYGLPDDVASVVAGAAAGVGYGYTGETSGSVVAVASTPGTPVATPGYQAGLIPSPAPQPLSLFGLSQETILIGGIAAVVALMLLSKK